MPQVGDWPESASIPASQPLVELKPRVELPARRPPAAGLLDTHGRRRLKSRIEFQIYRNRYLLLFILIGFVSIAAEVLVADLLLSRSLFWLTRHTAAFAFGVLLSFALNSTLNFRVPRKYMLRTFVVFVLVSMLSFTVNMAMIARVKSLMVEENFAALRFASAGVLFVISYTLHRRYTFDRAKSFGPAVYASEPEDVEAIFAKVGWNCDHIHVDLVDATRRPDTPAADLGKIVEVHHAWPGLPVCLHIMSTRPAAWASRTWELVDWYIFDLDSEDNLMDLLWQARLRRKKVGVTWHCDTSHIAILPYLPHVDFVLVLGIARPGSSGQDMLPEALAAAELLDQLRERYEFEIIFDGGVTTRNVDSIPAKYVVAASAVLNAENPVNAAYRLMTGSGFERS